MIHAAISATGIIHDRFNALGPLFRKLDGFPFPRHCHQRFGRFGGRDYALRRFFVFRQQVAQHIHMSQLHTGYGKCGQLMHDE